ncbi:hypothetical protein CYMTET_29720 [Cymbomonas tetramitiformis]|uniref:Uncharacterized protein n=1 Tax=Cymbomonas tetramitiformis TaxID=36881 RepID=A0AAE0FKG7_9CHLO|nr:hypothetical protein CYMTET_29720 [Cymbomonas tetramitiformis]
MTGLNSRLPKEISWSPVDSFAQEAGVTAVREDPGMSTMRAPYNMPRLLCVVAYVSLVLQQPSLSVATDENGTSISPTPAAPTNVLFPTLTPSQAANASTDSPTGMPTPPMYDNTTSPIAAPTNVVSHRGAFKPPLADVDIAQVQSSANGTEGDCDSFSSSYDYSYVDVHGYVLAVQNGSGLTGVWLQASSDPYAAIFIMTAMPELLNSYYTVVAMVLEHDYYHPVAEQQIVTVLTNILDEQSYPLRPDSKAPVQPLQVNCSLFVANCTEDAMAHDGVYVVLESVVVTQAPSQYGGWFYVMDDTGIAAVGSDMGYDGAPEGEIVVEPEEEREDDVTMASGDREPEPAEALKDWPDVAFLVREELLEELAVAVERYQDGAYAESTQRSYDTGVKVEGRGKRGTLVPISHAVLVAGLKKLAEQRRSSLEVAAESQMSARFL